MDKNRWMTYAPYFDFDEKEPFFPVRLGVREYRPGDASDSFRRVFDPDEWAPGTETILEYAIYYDYDIQHLYDLEHAWIGLDSEGRITDAEASFHGDYLKALLPDRSNVEDGTHVVLAVQPGKHALMPRGDYFRLVPDVMTAPSKKAGGGGLLINNILQGRIRASTDEAERETANRLANEYMQTCAFVPTLNFTRRWKPEAEHLVSWQELYEEIPRRIEAELKRLAEWAKH